MLQINFLGKQKANCISVRQPEEAFQIFWVKY